MAILKDRLRVASLPPSFIHIAEPAYPPRRGPRRETQPARRTSSSTSGGEHGCRRRRRIEAVRATRSPSIACVAPCVWQTSAAAPPGRPGHARRRAAGAAPLPLTPLPLGEAARSSARKGTDTCTSAHACTRAHVRPHLPASLTPAMWAPGLAWTPTAWCAARPTRPRPPTVHPPRRALGRPRPPIAARTAASPALRGHCRSCTRQGCDATLFYLFVRSACSDLRR